MGLGDWIIATAQVKRAYAGEPVAVVNKAGRLQWSDVFAHNPKVARQVGSTRILSCAGHRPYIAGKTVTHWQWRRWDIAPGELYLSDAERAFAAPYAGHVLIEPTTKVAGSNKAWLPDRWQKVVDAGDSFVQVGQGPWLRGVIRVPTTFRQACAVLAVSRGFLGTEGALHHAAAALNVPAVVLWSHFIAPEFTGYATQRNIRRVDDWCGSRVPCHGCQRSMAAITVGEVLANMEGM